MAIRVEGSSSGECDGSWNRIAASSAKCKGNKARRNFYQGQQFFDALRIGDEIDHPLAPECLLVKEAQSADCLDQCSPAVFPLLYKVKLVLADVSWCEEVGRLSKVLGKVSHTTDISLNSVRRVIADLHILNHFLTQCGHRDSDRKS